MMRRDVEKLLHQDEVFLWGPRKKRMENLCGLLDENETAKVVLLGQLELYHGTMPVPERMEAAACITDRGIALYGKVWRFSASFHHSWQQLNKFDTSYGQAAGVHIELADEKTKYIFLENYRGKISEQHKDAVERIKQLYFYQERK